MMRKKKKVNIYGPSIPAAAKGAYFTNTIAKAAFPDIPKPTKIC